jgi:hypothetical protein
MFATEERSDMTSAISDLRKLIEAQNPFDRSLVVKSHDVWAQTFPDLPSINGHVSDAIFQGIAQVQAGNRSVLGLTITAEKGSGKSHLISRIRHQIKREGNAFFVYMSETDYADLNRINSMFLNTLAHSLNQDGASGLPQWQELATCLVNEIYKSQYTAQELIKKFPGVLAKHPHFVDKVTTEICKQKANITDPFVIQAILWNLSSAHRIFAVNWLAGKELSQFQADKMGLPVIKAEDQEAKSLGIASQILDLIDEYRTIVICFDEVDSTKVSDGGLTTPQVVASLAKDLYSKIKRGVLMMTIYPQTWQNVVKTMPHAHAVVDRIGEKVLEPRNPNADDIVALVSEWLKPFYAKAGLTPPHSVYPFEEQELRALGRERPIIRNVLKWCCENWQKEPVDPLHPVEVAFREQRQALEKQLDTYLDDSTAIAKALFLGFQSVEQEKISSVFVESVEMINAKAADRGYVHFRILGRDNDAPIKIGVSALQESGSKYVSAALKRLIDYKKFDITRGCVVRSKEVKTGTKGREHLDVLLNEQGGELVTPNKNDLHDLLAIRAVFDACGEYEVTQAQVIEFMRKQDIAINNYLIGEILSDPSGHIPNSMVDEDQILSEAILASDDLTLDSELPAVLEF